MALIQARYLEHILLSHDTGWYNPAHSDGLPNEGYRGYTALSAQGVSEEQIRHITVDNPARAFAF